MGEGWRWWWWLLWYCHSVLLSLLLSIIINIGGGSGGGTGGNPGGAGGGGSSYLANLQADSICNSQSPLNSNPVSTGMSSKYFGNGYGCGLCRGLETSDGLVVIEISISPKSNQSVLTTTGIAFISLCFHS